MSFLAKNYNRKKISFKYGKGCYLYSTNKKKYLDFVQGIAVNSLGHAHPKLLKTIQDQSKNESYQHYLTKYKYIYFQSLLVLKIKLYKNKMNL